MIAMKKSGGESHAVIGTWTIHELHMSSNIVFDAIKCFKQIYGPWDTGLESKFWYIDRHSLSQVKCGSVSFNFSKMYGYVCYK